MADDRASHFENPLVKRFLFTLMALIVFRIGVHIPTPGVNTKALTAFASQQGGLLKILNMFSGGALGRFSIFALGVMPYISASIIIQLMTVVVPALEQLQKEGGVGRQKINRITRILTILIAIVQGFIFSSGLQSIPETAAGATVLEPGLGFKLMATLILTAGTCFVMWVGEQITEKGMGNGISILIFSGIVAGFPNAVGIVVGSLRDGSASVLNVAWILAFMVALIFGVALIEESYRKIPIHYAKRIVGRQLMSSQSSHLPIKVSMSGVIPPIFASTLLAVPASFAGFSGQRSQNIWLSELYPNRWLYNVVFALLVLFFCYFYTSIVFKPDDVAENLKKQNAYIPGIRPGTETAEALDMVVSRLTLLGAVYMNFVCLVPSAAGGQYSTQFSMGGTSLLIVVSVALETIRQISAQIATQQYDNLVFTSASSTPQPTL